MGGAAADTSNPGGRRKGGHAASPFFRSASWGGGNEQGGSLGQSLQSCESLPYWWLCWVKNDEIMRVGGRQNTI